MVHRTEWLAGLATSRGGVSAEPSAFCRLIRAPRQLHMKSVNVTGYALCLFRLRVSFGGEDGGRHGCRVLFRDFVCQFGVKMFVKMFVQVLIPVLEALFTFASAASLHQHNCGDNRCDCR